MYDLQKGYEVAKELYAQYGVDVDKAMELCDKTPISIHCWQGDDVVGFEKTGGALTGGIQTTGNYPGKARTPEELRADMDFALGFVPGAKKINIHASYNECDTYVDRDYPLGVDVGSMIGKIRDMLTFEGLCYAMYDYPAMVEDMVETCCVLVEQTLDQLLPHFDFDFASGWEDICFKNGPIVTPAFFRDVVMPRYKRIHQKLKAHGVDIWYMDCDGDIRPILDYFLEGGVNCMFPYEVNGCCHPAELLAAYGKDLRIMGGIDKMQLKAGRDAIRAYLESVAPLVERGGYIPFCDHRCPPDVREEDYLFYLDRKRDMFGMK